MIQDLIRNGDFKAGSTNWNSASSYSENTIKFYKSEYLNYVTLTVRSTGDREVLDAMFQSYFDMGGNGVIKHLKEEIDALPTWIENIH